MLIERLSELKKTLVEYSNLIEAMLKKSLDGYTKSDKEILNEVIKKYEPKANDYELEIDELCINIIAQYQPNAVDLRTILMILKINNDLERIGDHAVNIAESSLYLMDNPIADIKTDVGVAGDILINMFKDTMKAFIDKDARTAKGVNETDQKINDFRRESIKESIRVLGKNPDIIESGLFFLRITSNMERIGDLITNICEDIVFMVEGKVIKHNIVDK
ncbi:phosphate signaling complex protein PhoU [bacterium]